METRDAFLIFHPGCVGVMIKRLPFYKKEARRDLQRAVLNLHESPR